jgi:hypothetical protein
MREWRVDGMGIFGLVLTKYDACLVGREKSEGRREKKGEGRGEVLCGLWMKVDGDG